jgi:hypothetical protein
MGWNLARLMPVLLKKIGLGGKGIIEANAI